MPLQCIFMCDYHPIGSSSIHYLISLVFSKYNYYLMRRISIYNKMCRNTWYHKHVYINILKFLKFYYKF